VDESELERYRFFLKDTIRRQIDFRTTDQSRGVAPPPIEKPPPDDAERIALTAPQELAGAFPIDLTVAIGRRQSMRRFADEPLALEEVSFLLWATQGVRGRVGPGVALRTVPSAGARHSFETYVCARRVEGLEEAIYRYLPLEHELVLVKQTGDLSQRVTAACLGQAFAGQAAVAFFWTTIPYRMEWRYGLAAHKVIAVDAGHVCQNLYLCCEAIGAGTCAIGAYDQDAADELLGVDGRDEFTLYIAPVGKRPGGRSNR
jgi:SagB-type dehydrogenase family enzyme